MKKRILVQFDGSNFYKKVKRILPKVHLTKFDYVRLAHSLTEDKSTQVIYYSRALQKNCSSCLILKKNQILKFAKVKRS